MTSPRLAELKKEFEQNGGEWEKYTLEHAQLFQIKGSKSLDEGKLTFTENGINFVGRVDDNNGIKGKISLQDFNPNEKNTITATVIGNYKYAKFQESEYYCSQNINVLKPNFEINRFIALYLVTHIQKFISKYNGQQSGYKLNELAKHEIILPTLNKSLAFDYMERYIGELEQARVGELEQARVGELAAYLRAAGLENYDLTAAEQTALNDFKNGKIRFKEFKIGELFDIVKGKRLTKENIKPGNINFLGAISSNNGIRERIETTTVLKPNCISVNYNGSVGCSFYQEEPFYASDDVNICYSKENWILNRKRALFFCAVFKNFSQKFSYTQKWNKERMIESFVFLPITDDAPDFAFMESFVTAQQKLAIRDVVLWKDKVISETRKITKV